MTERPSILGYALLHFFILAAIGFVAFLFLTMHPWFPWFEPHTFAASLGIMGYGFPALGLLAVVGLVCHRVFALPWSTGLFPLVVVTVLGLTFAVGNVCGLPDWIPVIGLCTTVTLASFCVAAILPTVHILNRNKQGAPNQALYGAKRSYESKMKRIALIIFLGLLAPCYAEQASQIQKEYDADGNLKHSFEVFSVPTGTVMGIIREYYTDGTLKSETPIKAAAGELGFCPEGAVKTYHPNGEPDSVVTYESCVENGPFERRYPDGTLRAQGVFSNGTIVSVHRTNRHGEPIASTNHLSLVSLRTTYSDSRPIRLYCDVNADWHGRFAWLFLYRLDNDEWIEKIRFNDFQPQRYEKGETRIITYPTDGLEPGKWKARLTFSITGPGRGGEFPGVESEAFTIEQ